MLRLPATEMVARIRDKECFHAVCDDYSFTLKIEDYAPYVCAAVHDGHQFRPSLWEHCLHTEHERWYEEDPCTKQMVDAHPIVLAGCDSRFEYDLNRPPETAIYTDAWGKKLWRNPLPETERRKSLEKHGAFYGVVHALIGTLEAMHGKLLVFDMHSYNWKRWDRPVPTWNLGTANVDGARYAETIRSWSKRLGGITLPHGIPETSGINDTFQGNGHFLKYITGHFGHTLVLATEVAKVYCDEHTGTIFPEVVQAVASQLKELIPLQASEFHKRT
ncbi:N-formylglutamate amidohydrolase [Maribacter sp. 2307ULW6-5]|uniref:N-formylglutamate amidohydrolase n=1 Tax=Maribacter sp. 2307ULW6-5 TaxID=3386275 RepID=UPI0039BD14BE